MTRSELNALKEKARNRRDKSNDLDLLARKLTGLLALLPKDVREVLEKYRNKEETL